MSRTTNSLAVTAVATAGFFWGVLVLSSTAAAAPAIPTSPGAPCLNILQQLAVSPPSMPESLPDAVSAFTGVGSRRQ